jgi:riboflavin kinase/FMN adenylyltransferase
MRVLDQPWREWVAPSEQTSATVGVLDGVHLGHRQLIDTLRPSGLKTVVTFDPHPIEVLTPGTIPRLLTTVDERLDLLECAGVEVAAILDLREIRELSPAEFVAQVLVDKLNIGALAVGVDFRFGRDRAGDVSLLKELSTVYRYELDAIELVEKADEAISSSRIRFLIEEGDVAGAAALLGSRYRITNQVIHGDKRGRTIGFPTANLNPPSRKLIPGDGVYAALAHTGGKRHMAAVNIGVRPTFGAGERLVEAYLLDFDADIYDDTLELQFVERLRDELEFDGVERLVEQMHLDVSKSRQILESLDPVVG